MVSLLFLSLNSLSNLGVSEPYIAEGLLTVVVFIVNTVSKKELMVLYESNKELCCEVNIFTKELNCVE